MAALAAPWVAPYIGAGVAETAIGLEAAAWGATAAAGAAFMTPPRTKRPRSSDVPNISPAKMPKRNKKNVYQGGSSRARYSKRMSGNTVVTKYEKRLIKKNTKRGGSARLFDMVAPPLVIYNRAFYPRHLTEDFAVLQCNGKTVETNGHLKSVMQIPMLTTKEAATYILKSQSVPHTLSWNDNSEVWRGFPVLGDGTEAGMIDFDQTNSMTNVEATNDDATLDTYLVDGPHQVGGPNFPGPAQSYDKQMYVSASAPISTGLYGYVEEIKYTYKITNPNEVKVTIDLMEVRPRDPITDVDHLAVSITDEIVTNSLDKSYIQPLTCIKADWKHRKDYSCQIKDVNDQQMFPLAVGKTASDDEWVNYDGGKYFNRYYKIISKKSKTLMPGEIFMYDVVIPGFGFNFDRYIENQVTNIHTSEADYTYKLKEMQSTFTRFLLLKFRGVPQFNANTETGEWVMGQKGYPIGLKCNLVARKYLKARLVPKTSRRLKMRTEGSLDIDAFGRMNDSSIPTRSFNATDMMTFNGKNVQAVNKYPNVMDVNIVNPG